MSSDESDNDQIALLMAAEILRRDPGFRSQRERERIERAMERQLERQQERRAILEGYQLVMDDLLRNGWQHATAGICAVCDGPASDRDLGAVLDELRNRSDEVPLPVPGPALVCPRATCPTSCACRSRSSKGPREANIGSSGSVRCARLARSSLDRADHLQHGGWLA